MSNSPEEHDAKLEVYYIPHNFEDAGGVLGGRVSTRNFIELVALCGPIAFLEYKLLCFSWETNIIIALVTLGPLAFLCFFGIGGESLSQILFAAIQFLRKRRRLTYRKFVGNAYDPTKFTLGTFVDSVSSVGLKKTFELMKAAKEKANEAKPEVKSEAEILHAERPKHAKAKQPHKEKKKAHKAEISHAPPVYTREVYHDEPRQHKPRHEVQTRSQNKVLNSALKEMLIRKLELGNDDEDEDDFFY